MGEKKKNAEKPSVEQNGRIFTADTSVKNEYFLRSFDHLKASLGIWQQYFFAFLRV